MRFHRQMTIAIAAGATLALAACSTTPEPTTAPVETAPDVVIGAPLPLSGGGAAFGVPYLAALQATVDAINADGGIQSLGGAQLVLNAVDDGSDAARDALLIEQMAAEGVSVFAGPLLSATVINSVPVITRSEVPFVGPQLDNAVTEAQSPWIFRVSNRADAWGDQAFEYIKSTLEEQGDEIDKIGIVGIDVPPGTSTTDRLLAGAEAEGWDPVRISYDQKTTLDFAPIVAQLAEADVDLITGYQNPNDAVLFAQAISKQDWRPSLGFVWIAGGQYLSSFKEATGDVAENWLDVSYGSDLSNVSNEKLQAVASAFEDETGFPMVGLASSAPAIITVIAAAIEKAASADPAAIREALESLEWETAADAPFPYYSMAGGVKFNLRHDNTLWRGTIIQWQDGKQVTVSPEDIATGDLVWPAR
jgi:branched-chain amino acid transport system substrate-binding protein